MAYCVKERGLTQGSPGDEVCYDPVRRSLRSTSLHTDAPGTAPPDAFGPFRVLHQIGAGTLGPVFRAYDPEQEKLVAVKWFRLDLPPERTHRLVAELEQLIAADEAALGDYISDPERTKQGASGDVAAIAERMPKLQNELRELRRQREAAASAAPNVSSP